MRSSVGVAIASILLAAACGGDSGSIRTLTIVVNAPFSKTPYVGETIARGAELGASLAGPIETKHGAVRLRVDRMDNALSPRHAIANVRQAVADGAVAIIDEGTGVDASWRIAADAEIPICITYQGDIDLVDVERRPNVFRIAPTDRGIAFRLAEYLIPKGLRVAILTDDSAYGEAGRDALARSFGENPEAVAIRLRLPADAPDLSPRVLRARRAGATALIAWGRPTTIANVLTAARSRRWAVPVYSASSGADPLVRQQLADQPDWVDGLTFASGRMTAELGPAAWQSFESLFESRYGPDLIGVKTSNGQDVVQPPEHAMYSYDFVAILAAALAQAGSNDRASLLEALNEVTVQGANGDERGFNLHNHEGVIDDDVYFARFDDMTFRPVKDDLLSSRLPMIDQTR
jgi:ABC-type branched-subunit amino acid transport system substrate-binding protein